MLRALLLASLLAAGAGAQGRTLEVGPGREFRAPSAAAAAARDGDHVRIEPGEYRDCAVWLADNLVVEGVGDAAGVVIADRICSSKALFVTVGAGITIRNLTLTRAAVPDGNGAGIRGEGRNLVVENVRFIGNENGILSGTVGGSMIIRDSVFDRNGSCRNACAHGVYVGNLDLLQVERSRFTRTREAHHIKSRALRTEVSGCTIEDGPEGTASYEIEAPNGGSLLVRGNAIEKGAKAGNRRSVISIGAEGVRHPTREILIEDNTFRNTGPFETTFVTNLTTTAAVLRNNRLTGRVVPLHGEGQVSAAR